MRILHVTLFVDIGGLEKLIFDMGNHFVRQGDDVEVLCLREINQDYLAKIGNEKIPVHLFRKKGRLDFGYHWRVARFIRNGKYDVLHAHSGCFWDAALFSIFSGIKKNIYTAHGLPVNHGLKARLEDMIAGVMTNNIVAVSAEIEQVLKKLLPFSRKKISTIINGVDTHLFVPMIDQNTKIKLLDKYKLPKTKFRIGSVGRLSPEKNHQMLIDVFAQLLPKYKNEIDLIIVGKGPLENELKEKATDLGVSGNVYFLGMQHEIFEILPLLDVFVLPSFTEGTSISLLEAQACGVPAVATDVGGNSYVIEDKKNGMLCPVNDPDSMISCINTLLLNNLFKSQCSILARKRAEDIFSLKVMATQYNQLYRAR